MWGIKHYTTMGKRLHTPIMCRTYTYRKIKKKMSTQFVIITINKIPSKLSFVRNITRADDLKWRQFLVSTFRGQCGWFTMKPGRTEQKPFVRINNDKYYFLSCVKFTTIRHCLRACSVIRFKHWIQSFHRTETETMK